MNKITKIIKKAITFDFYIPKPLRIHVFYWLIILNIVIAHNLYNKYNEIYGELLTKTNTAQAKEITVGAKGSLAESNNNPCNLRYAKQKGATEGKGGFAKFDTLEAGFRACTAQIRLDQSRNLTIDKFINKYAPESENDTKRYIKNLCNGLNIADIETEALTAKIMELESGIIIN
jgi:dsRNA-specific ribonuclease